MNCVNANNEICKIYGFKGNLPVRLIFKGKSAYKYEGDCHDLDEIEKLAKDPSKQTPYIESHKTHLLKIAELNQQKLKDKLNKPKDELRAVTEFNSLADMLFTSIHFGFWSRTSKNIVFSMVFILPCLLFSLWLVRPSTFEVETKVKRE